MISDALLDGYALTNVWYATSAEYIYQNTARLSHLRALHSDIVVFTGYADILMDGSELWDLDMMKDFCTDVIDRLTSTYTHDVRRNANAVARHKAIVPLTLARRTYQYHKRNGGPCYKKRGVMGSELELATDEDGTE